MVYQKFLVWEEKILAAVKRILTTSEKFSRQKYSHDIEKNLTSKKFWQKYKNSHNNRKILRTVEKLSQHQKNSRSIRKILTMIKNKKYSRRKKDKSSSDSENHLYSSPGL